MAAFKWQQPRSNTLGARDLNFCIKFRGVPNHIRALMSFKYFVVQRIPQVIGSLDVAKATHAHFKGPNFHDFNESKQPWANESLREIRYLL